MTVDVCYRICTIDRSNFILLLVHLFSFGHQLSFLQAYSLFTNHITSLNCLPFCQKQRTHYNINAGTICGTTLKNSKTMTLRTSLRWFCSINNSSNQKKFYFHSIAIPISKICGFESFDKTCMRLDN